MYQDMNSRNLIQLRCHITKPRVEGFFSQHCTTRLQSMALSGRVAIIGTEESFQVLFGGLPKHQSMWVWGEVSSSF
jgi:hypothetical protein